jgi:hypothetical protein
VGVVALTLLTEEIMHTAERLADLFGGPIGGSMTLDTPTNLEDTLLVSHTAQDAFAARRRPPATRGGPNWETHDTYAEIIVYIGTISA